MKDVLFGILLIGGGFLMFVWAFMYQTKINQREKEKENRNNEFNQSIRDAIEVERARKRKAIIDHYKLYIHLNDSSYPVYKTHNNLNKIPKFNDIAHLERSITDKNVEEGPSEQFFSNYLNKYFPGEFKRFLQINGRFPDFYFPSIKTVVEIDEPYTLKGKKPIHIRDSSDGSFLNYGIDILRFAEEQILINPIGCCKIIATIMVQKNNNYNHEVEIFEAQSVQRISRWNSSSAMHMIRNRHRENLLAKYVNK